MNARNRLYIMAFAVYTSALLVTAVFAWLAIRYDIASNAAQLAIAITGNGLGGFALVLGILRDDRAQKAEEEAAKARQETAKAKQQADEFQKLYVELQQQTEQQRQQAEQQRQQAEQQRQQAEQFRQQAEQERLQAEQERQRAERAEAELQRLRAEHDHEVAARLHRLEIAAGITPPDASDDATEI